jgi:hypothetical protein
MMLLRNSALVKIKATLDQILYINDYRIKTNAIKLYEELFSF